MDDPYPRHELSAIERESVAITEDALRGGIAAHVDDIVRIQGDPEHLLDGQNELHMSHGIPHLGLTVGNTTQVHIRRQDQDTAHRVVEPFGVCHLRRNGSPVRPGAARGATPKADPE